MCLQIKSPIIFLLVISMILPTTLAQTNNDKDQELKIKVAQMLLIGFRGTVITADSYIVRVMKDINIGGVVLFDYDVPSQSFPRNILNPEQTKKLIMNLKIYAQTPLLIAVDAEGGRVNRLKDRYGFFDIPSAQEMGKKSPEASRATYEKLAQQLSDLGFNTNFAPVVDLNLNPKNPIIGGLERSFSEDPQTVIRYALMFIDVHHEKRIITTLKHFPGHGSSLHDSHLNMVDVTRSYQKEELHPFKELIKKGYADLIMTAHIMNTQTDPNYPATLSHHFIQELLRDDLGFTGVVISDDMQMGAIRENYGFSAAIIRSINAGCNIITISNNGKSYDETAVYRAHSTIIQAVKTGMIPIQKINNSYEKIQGLKKKYFTSDETPRLSHLKNQREGD